MKKHKAFGVDFEESEKISSYDQFYRDGSGSFRSLSNAMKHFDKLLNKLVCDVNVEPKSPDNIEVIEECQPVGDNVVLATTCIGTYTFFYGSSGINWKGQ